MEKDTLGRTTFDIMQHPGVVSSSFRERGRHAAAGGDILQSAPERVLKADTRLVPRNHDGALDDR